MASGALLEIVERLSGKVVISSEVNEEDISGFDTEALLAHILKHFEGKEGLQVFDKIALGAVLSEMKTEKEPVQVEVVRTDYKPFAKETSSEFEIRNAKISKVSSSVSDFVEHFNDRFTRLGEIIKRYSFGSGFSENIESTRRYLSGREFTVLGIVYDKFITKKGHVLVTLEDTTGTAKVLFMKPGDRGGEVAELFEAAKRLVNDDVIAVRGKNSGPFIIANRFLFPDIPVHTKAKGEEDVSIAFISDIHVGSRYFMEEHFGKFIKWLRGDVESSKEIASKIKYLVVGGDLVDGVGVYPRQDRELLIDDLEKQYSVFFNFMESVPDYIETFVLTGNHDGVQRAEPQPQLGFEMLNGFAKDNVHLVTNPCYLRLNGIKILAYHGTSLDSVIRSIRGCSYAEPQKAMLEVLKRRHLASIYGDAIVVPSRYDAMVIDEVPDILHMGHVHKNGYEEYHGTTILNSGTWQSVTDYQVIQGHIPSPALLPVYETQTMQTTLVDFTR